MPPPEKEKKPYFNYELTAYVKNLPKSMSEGDIRELFGSYGYVNQVHILKNEQFVSNRALIEMSTKEQTELAVSALNKWKDSSGHAIYVEQFKYLPPSERNGAKSSANGKVADAFKTDRQLAKAGIGMGRGAHFFESLEKSSAERKSKNPERRQHSQYSGNRDSLTSPDTSQSSTCNDFDVVVDEDFIDELKDKVRVNKDPDISSIHRKQSSDMHTSKSEPVLVRLHDFTSPSQLFLVVVDQKTKGKLPSVKECCLDGIMPIDGSSWSDSVIDFLSNLGLAIGGQYLAEFTDTSGDVFKVNFYFKNGIDIAQKLVKAGLACLKHQSKVKTVKSIHSYLEPGQSIQLMIDNTSVKSVNSFYAQIISRSFIEETKAYQEMEPKMNSYANHIANKPSQNIKSVTGDYVLAPYKGNWYRGLITAANNDNAVVAFIDYGNISVCAYQQILPLPDQFSKVPALAVLCKLHGLSEVTVHIAEQIVDKIKSLAHSLVKAVVRLVGEDFISVDILNDNGENISQIFNSNRKVSTEDLPKKSQREPSSTSQVLLNKTLAAGDFEPEQKHKRQSIADRLVARTVSSDRKHYRLKDVTHTTLPIGKGVQVLLTNASLESLYVQTTDRVGIENYVRMISEVSAVLESQTKPLTVTAGEILFAYMSDCDEWDRVLVLDNQQASVHVRSCDYGNEYYTELENLREITEQAVHLPMRAVPIALTGLDGELNETGQQIMESMHMQRVSIIARDGDHDKKFNCIMYNDKGECINEKLKPFLRAKHIKGDKGDAHLSATYSTSLEEKLKNLEGQIDKLQNEKISLIKEITKLKRLQ